MKDSDIHASWVGNSLLAMAKTGTEEVGIKG